MSLVVQVVLVVCLVASVRAQMKTSCPANSSHICTGRDKFRPCMTDPSTGLSELGSEFPCSLLSSELHVCYESDDVPSSVCELPPPPCNQTGAFQITGRCRSFYVCVSASEQKYQQFIATCDSGYEFSATERQCQRVTPASNCFAPPTPSPTPSTTTTPTPTPTPSTTTTPTPTPTPSTTTVSSIPPTPPCIPDTNLTDPTSCRHFYVCMESTTLIRVQCARGKLFDQNLRICTSRAVDCGLRPY